MKSNHHGENVRRWREMLGFTQETLAEKIGIAQPKMSKLEQQPNVDDDTLDKISKAIGIPVQLLKECDHEDNRTKIVNYFNNDNGTFIDTQINNPLQIVNSLHERILNLSIELERMKWESGQKSPSRKKT